MIRPLAAAPAAVATAPSTRRLGVVIVTYNSAAVIEQLLDTLPAALSGIATHRVMVVDNNSADATPHIVARRDDVTLVRNPRNLGYAAACNVGAAHLDDDDDLLLLNADLRPEPGSIARMLAVADEHDQIAVVVPRLVDDHGGTALSQRREPTVSRAVGEAVLGRRARRFSLSSEVVADAGRYETSGPTDWATGAAMLITSGGRRRVGRWDERFFLYSEETDYCLRVADAGMLTWYEPTATMQHSGGAAHTDPRLWSLLTVNRVKLFGKRNGPAAARLFWAAAFLGEVLRLPRHPRHRAASGALLRLALSRTIPFRTVRWS
ncbi:glycosyltransferase [Euzebya tangerina]|uniref:glycosyltransferase n=1 Tax=Euzebya tangerina TaxID=591198 RepID=UPI0013C36E33|nr:glycosyltransferase family 2 protein [Euzebya tangerina]